MKIDHIAVYVCDLEREKAFFTRFFGAKAGGKYRNQATGLQTYFFDLCRRRASGADVPS